MSFSKVIIKRSLATFHKGKEPWNIKPGQHQKNEDLWKKLAYFVALPAVALVSINTYLGEKEHMEHFHRAPFVPYNHLRIRNSIYPWRDGVKTLFHHPKYNALPDGYEDEQ